MWHSEEPSFVPSRSNSEATEPVVIADETLDRLTELLAISDRVDGSPLPDRVGELAADHPLPAVRAAALTVVADNATLGLSVAEFVGVLEVLHEADREYAVAEMHRLLVPFRYMWLRAHMVVLDRLESPPDEIDRAVRDAYSFACDHDYEPGIRAGKTNLGLRAADVGRPVEALLHLVDVFSIMPPDERFHGFAHRGIARLLAGAGLHAESVAQLELSVDLLERVDAPPSEQIPGLADMALSAIEVGDVDTAAGLIERMDSLAMQASATDYTSRASPRLAEVRLRTAENRGREAVDLFEVHRTLIEAASPLWFLHPGQVETSALLAAGDPNAALERALGLHDLFPVQMPTQYWLLSEIYSELERWPEAISALRESERRRATYVFDPAVFLGIGRTRLSDMESQVADLMRTTEGNGDRLRRRDTMLSHVTHEVRGPLTVLISSVDLWERDGIGPEAGSLIRSLVSQIRGSLDAIVAHTDLESGQLLDGQGSVALDVLIAEVIGLFGPLAEAKGSTIVWEQATPLDIVGYGDQIRLALSNLISNALKFSPAGSRIEVRCHTEPAGSAGRAPGGSGGDTAGLGVGPTSGDGRVGVITVLDQGPGFADIDLRHAFQPNTRLSAEPTAGESSTGIGLSLVKSAVESCGGTVRIANRPLGGAALSLRIPVVQLTEVLA